jgi:hypothetical protein
MFYPDLEENSSRGIISGAISKYQRNVCLYPAAFALLVNFFNQVINLFCFMQTYHSNGYPTASQSTGSGQAGLRGV